MCLIISSLCSKVLFSQNIEKWFWKHTRKYFFFYVIFAYHIQFASSLLTLTVENLNVNLFRVVGLLWKCWSSSESLCMIYSLLERTYLKGGWFFILMVFFVLFVGMHLSRFPICHLRVSHVGGYKIFQWFGWQVVLLSNHKFFLVFSFV